LEILPFYVDLFLGGRPTSRLKLESPLGSTHCHSGASWESLNSSQLETSWDTITVADGISLGVAEVRVGVDGMTLAVRVVDKSLSAGTTTLAASIVGGHAWAVIAETAARSVCASSDSSAIPAPANASPRMPNPSQRARFQDGPQRRVLPVCGQRRVKVG
jgi:hypothetical protein